VILVDGMCVVVGVSLPHPGAVFVTTPSVDLEDDLYLAAASAIALDVDSGELPSFVSPLLL